MHATSVDQRLPGEHGKQSNSCSASLRANDRPRSSASTTEWLPVLSPRPTVLAYRYPLISRSLGSMAPILVSAGIITVLTLTGCGQAGQNQQTTDDGRTQLTMWTHSAGNPAELEVYEQIITDFNASQDAYQVVHESFPQGAYNEAIVAAASSGDLPCLLDLDGPIMPNWAWAGYLQPLELPIELTDKLLPTAVGLWQDEIYSAGYWDAALGIFARASVLEANGIRVPTIEEPFCRVSTAT